MTRFILVLLLILPQGTVTTGPTKTAGPTVIQTGIGGGGAITWTLTQHSAAIVHCSTVSSCAGTLPGNDTAGDLVVVMGAWFVNGGAAPVFSSISGSETMTHCPSQAGSVNPSGSILLDTDCAYILSAAGGFSSFTFNLTATTNDIDIYVLEFARSSGTASIDTCGAGGAIACVATSTSCTTCTGATPTITGNADVVMTWAAFGQVPTGVASPYNTSPSPVLDTTNVEGGFGWSLSQTSANAASWSQTPTGAASLSTIAFK